MPANVYFFRMKGKCFFFDLFVVYLFYLYQPIMLSHFWLLSEMSWLAD